MNDENKSWKQLASTVVYQDQWFHARADKCELPDGRILEPYYIVEVPNWCNTVMVTNDEKIILVKQYRYPINKTTLELPGGIIEKNEIPLQAALREMEEETGYTSNEIEFLFKVAPNPALQNNTAYFYLAKNAVKTTTQSLDQFEEIEIELFDKEQIKKLLAENKMQHGVQIGAVYEALTRLGWLEWK